MRAVVIDSKVIGTGHTKALFKTRTASLDLRKPKVLVVDIPDPKVGPTDILIKIRACGICGSDVAMANEDAKGFVTYPFMMSNYIVPGHEFSGIVAAIGKQVKKYWPDIEIGEPVTAQCVLNCGYCSACKVGAFDNCRNGDELGFTKNGAFAEFCSVDMRHVWSIKSFERVYGTDQELFLLAESLVEPHATDQELFLAGSLVEPHAGVYKAITESSFTPGDSVLVVGLGTVGLAAVNVFRALGAGKIIGCDVRLVRRGGFEVAKILGASSVYNPYEIPIDIAVKQETKGTGVNIIFEATGLADQNWNAITNLLQSGPHNAELIFFGQSKEDLAINPQLFIQKYARFSGSHGHTKIWQNVINLIAEQKIHPLPMNTNCIALEEVPEYLDLLQHVNNQIKVSVLM